MPSESLASIFRRDLDRHSGLADDEWVPTARRRGRPSVGRTLAVAALVIGAIVIGLSLK
jgi:hypothetical protein